MGIVFLICILGMVVISLTDYKNGDESKGLDVDVQMFKTTKGFAIGALIVVGFLVVELDSR